MIHVPPQAPLTSPCKIAFVGEAPSDEEVSKGRPFVGPAGRLFNSILRTAGLERENFLVTNVYDEQAPGNDCTEWMHDDAFTATNLSRLTHELETYRPNVVVPLGSTALWAFTGFSGIAKFRGAVTAATRIWAGGKLVPTFHPMAVMHQWKYLPVVTGDFIKAARQADLGPAIIYPHAELLLCPTLNDLRAFAIECSRSDLLSVDIETGWGQITCVGIGVSGERAMCIPFVDLSQPDRSYWRDAGSEVEALKIVRSILEGPTPKLGQNFTYDAMWLLKKWGIRVRNYLHDTRLMHHALYPELPKDLASMAASYTDVGAYKMWGGKYAAEKRDA